MTHPSEFRNTDRHEVGRRGEENFLALMAAHGIEVEDHRQDAPDTNKRFRINGFWVGTQVRTDGWKADGEWRYRDIFTDNYRTNANDIWVWHSEDLKFVFWVKKADDPSDPWPGSTVDMGDLYDHERPDMQQPRLRRWPTGSPFLRRHWAELIDILIPEISFD